jgi:hypothetical protein
LLERSESASERSWFVPSADSEVDVEEHEGQRRLRAFRPALLEAQLPEEIVFGQHRCWWRNLEDLRPRRGREIAGAILQRSGRRDGARMNTDCVGSHRTLPLWRLARRVCSCGHRELVFTGTHSLNW